jgi:adenosylhomocysteine nucleosidase
MTIAIECAIPQEHAHLAAALKHHETVSVGGQRFDRGDLDGREVVLALAGIGKVNTAMATALLIERFGAKTVVFSGVAGGLDPGLSIGDVVIAEETLQHDAGVLEDHGLTTYQAGHVPFFNPTERFGYPVAAPLLGRVRGALEDFTLPPLSRAAGGIGRPPVIAYGRILSGDQYIHGEAVRERLNRDLGGLAVEMESGALAQACEALGAEWLVIRALSDLAGRDSRFDFTAFVNEVAASSASILRRILPVL